MEIIALIFILWLIGCLFPGSCHVYIDIGGVIANILTAVIGFGLLYAYWGCSLAGIIWLGDRFGWNSDITMILAILGPIVTPMLIATAIQGIGELNARKKLGRRLQ